MLNTKDDRRKNSTMTARLLQPICPANCNLGVGALLLSLLIPLVTCGTQGTHDIPLTVSRIELRSDDPSASLARRLHLAYEIAIAAKISSRARLSDRTTEVEGRLATQVLRQYAACSRHV